MSALTPLKSLTIPSVTRHTATVIFVHGLGDTGHGWKPVADIFQADPGLHHVKWVLPHSPIRAVTANMGIEMPSWFDIYSFGFGEADEDETGMLNTVHSLNKLIVAEADAGIDPSRIVLGGFSQGGAMSILTSLTTERKLGGSVVLSGWVPLTSKFKSMAGPHAKTTPVFWGHGMIDPLVKYQFAIQSTDFLKNQIGVPVFSSSSSAPQGLDFKSYDGVGHSTNQQELDDLRDWLKRALPKEN